MSLQRPLHRYARLPDNDIRLLRLLPHQQEDAPIQCQLFNCALENSRGTRPYEALSYVWGSDHGSQSISIDSCYLPIGGNLFAALLHLRDSDIERILWIDAVCINQQDNMEKGHQVQAMAKIYAKATRVIVWLGKATPDIDQALEDIRIAGFTANIEARNERRTKGSAPKQTVNQNAILKLLEAAWFRRVWVLQEVAAARHIVVRCGPAEIDGYAFFSGLSALKLPYEKYPGLQPLVLSVAYLAKGAAFRPRSATSQAGRFSLNICHLGQLVDMYHNHQAGDDRDRIYALLGMSSDDPGDSGLLVDYDISWAKLFEQLVHSILGSVNVDTWDKKAVAVIRNKGYVLGLVDSVCADIDGNGKQLLKVTWNRLIYSGSYGSDWNLEASADPVKEGDVICLLQGAVFPTIIRMHGDYWYIIVIAAASPEHLQGAISDDKYELPRLPTIILYDFLLVWDWDLCLDESQTEAEYKDLLGYLAPKAPQKGFQTDCENIIMFWNIGMAMQDIDRRIGDEYLRKAIVALEHLLKNTNGLVLAGRSNEHQMMEDDMKQLQGTTDLIFKDKGGLTPLCLAAEVGCEVVARLLLDTSKVDLNAQDGWSETPLMIAVRKGHESIVKLLLSSDKIDPDAGHRLNRPKPLEEAVKNGHEAIVKLLVNTGNVDVNSTSFFRMTPLMYAAENGHTAIVELLLNTPDVDPDFGYHPRGTEFTALSLAVRNRHEEIVELLLRVNQVPLDVSYGGNESWDGLTLLVMAQAVGDKGIIKLLQRAEGCRELSSEEEIPSTKRKKEKHNK